MTSTLLRTLRRPTASLVRTTLTTRYTSTGILTPPSSLNPAETSIFRKLSAALSPSKLQVLDISGGCGSMYAIEIQAAAFKGLTMVRQHRLVNEVLAEEIKGWHGLQLKTKAE